MAGSKDFCDFFLAQLKLKGRFVKCEYESELGGRFDQEKRAYQPRTDTVLIDFANLPAERAGEKGSLGMEVANNRMFFTVDGFARFDPHGDPPKGKVKLEMSVNALGKQHNLRSKTDSPAKIAAYLAGFLNKIVETVPPKTRS